METLGDGWGYSEIACAHAIEAALTAARREGMEYAATIARTYTKRECPFDGPHDLEPTDPCPVCGGLGADGAEDKCVGSTNLGIAAAIRAKAGEQK